MTETHAVVTGAGPVGTNIALQLAEQGRPVRLLTRSGSGPEHPLIERLRADVSKPGELARHLEGADALFHCIHGSAYSAKAWARELPQADQVAMDAAATASVPVVFPESLYSYDLSAMPMTEENRRDAVRGKGGVRARLLRARAEHEAATVSVVASDFYGPHVRMAHAGDRMVPLVLEGKKITVMGSADVPHSFTYVPDLAAAMIAAAGERSAWNRVLHAPTAPAVTQRRMVEEFAAAAGVPAPKVAVLPAWALQAVGVVMPSVRELAETMPQLTAEFVVDSAATERLLGLAPTPLADGAAETVRWWRAAERLAA
ncbi:NAD-dependent epimerase/dehydratase family protein [Tomitella fengzijianii]|uniref:NAD-dependent epimerase/dehydratase family protein n=1 Tax=Tomitella fengzijianii TaxID=2597660 RepID=A0A516X290_9ACTN|nr:NAD-dependent epimerase/dehydratase family protein [Tomitella fengzijianii]QDQ97140.1 NAD-dependent epimerase/dehydratase family protein [Tomitella fengzijianii]